MTRNRRIANAPPAVVAAAFVIALFSVAAHAGFTFNTAPAPGGFLQACAGPSTPGSSPWPGSDFTALYTAPGSDVQELPFTGVGSAALAAAYSGGNTSNGCEGATGMGYAQLSAHNNAPNNSSFAGADANGGWSEIFTVNSPGLNGQTGFMQFTLDVSGTLFASGFAGSSSFKVTGYKDGVQLVANPLFDAGNSDPLGTGSQYGNWAVATFGNPPTAGKTVVDTVTFAVPITFGTPFKLGIYAVARAGMRSSSGVAGNSTAQTDFSDGLTWGGVAAVYHGMTPIGDYTIVSGTSVDWDGPVAPPSSADLNGDGVVDGADFGLLLSAWGTPDADLNGDGTTDGSDLGILLGAWT